MIDTKSQLKEYLAYEKKIYISDSLRDRLEMVLMHEPRWLIWKFVKRLRKMEYHHNNKKNWIHWLIYLYYRRKKNTLGVKLGLEMWDKTFGKGLTIEHNGSIVINGMAKVGENCILHGDNCIGNNGFELSTAPMIGDNVRIGVGAKIIGNIKIGNNIKIAAGAVVIHSFEEDGITLAGIPARKVK